MSDEQHCVKKTPLSYTHVGTGEPTSFTQDISMTQCITRMCKRIKSNHKKFPSRPDLCTITRVTGAICFCDGLCINVYFAWNDQLIKFNYTFRTHLYYGMITTVEQITEELLLHICDICDMLADTTEFEYQKIQTRTDHPANCYGIHWGSKDLRGYVLYHGSHNYIFSLENAIAIGW